MAGYLTTQVVDVNSTTSAVACHIGFQRSNKFFDYNFNINNEFHSAILKRLHYLVY